MRTAIELKYLWVDSLLAGLAWVRLLRQSFIQWLAGWLVVVWCGVRRRGMFRFDYIAIECSQSDVATEQTPSCNAQAVVSLLLNNLRRETPS